MNNEKKKLNETVAPASAATEAPATAPKAPVQAAAPVSQPTSSVSGAYVPSERVKAAEAAIAAQKKPTSYTSKWQGQIDDALSKILGREEFSYDVNADKLYDQYKDQYVRNGKTAMEDTVGKMSAMTGGYGNSWAQTAGQAAYAQEMEKLNDVIPELYGLALERYQAEGDAMRQNYGLLLDAESKDYGRYRDEMSDYLTERDYLTGLYENERAFDYGIRRDEIEDAQYAEQFAYQKDRDAVEDGRYDAEWQHQLDREAVEDGRYDTEWQHQLDREAIEDGRYADEVAYNRQMDARDYALSLIKAQSGGQSTVENPAAVEPEYLPFGSMSEDEFYKALADTYYSWNDPNNEGRGIEAAVALVKRAGATEEAKKALGDYFGEAVVKEAFPEAVPENVTSGKSRLLTKSQYMRSFGKESGIPYKDYVYETAMDMMDKGEITYEEAVEIIARSEG